MKRVIKAATNSIDLGRYGKYFQVDDPDTWIEHMSQEEIDEIVDWYKQVCDRYGYDYIALIEAKDPYYSNELDAYSAVVLSRNRDGQLAILDIVNDRIYDVTDEVDEIVETEIEV